MKRCVLERFTLNSALTMPSVSGAPNGYVSAGPYTAEPTDRFSSIRCCVPSATTCTVLLASGVYFVKPAGSVPTASSSNESDTSCS
ncbi:hypothetical protein [Cohnella rhizosphaerae]|uniref:Uncharacterized protein n=1 Tax=Cohnella rhizosphaerae TaxID=1457232 RepID=A0A9X4KZA6_9BACL|nr:hypothetical protein [Cohnella rhizosphaerae]MDG0810502.1 hypothetical protein [Cohnella rhizosphaerae]